VEKLAHAAVVEMEKIMGRPKGSKNKSKDDKKPIKILTGVNIPQEPKDPLESEIGKPVQYYQEGWRCGTLESIKKGIAKIIHPTTGSHKIPVNDIRSIKCEKESNGTGV
jgi:hypothetical protein